MAIFTYGSPAVQFREAMEGSGDAALSANAQVYRAIWKVAWADVENAKIALLGRTTAMPAAAGQPAYFARALPHALPKAPWLFATDIVRTEGRVPRGKDSNGMARYDWAFLWTQYTKLFCEVLPDTDSRVVSLTPGVTVPDDYRLARFFRKRRHNATLFMSNRVGGWRFLDTDRAVPLEVPWRIPRLRLLLTWLNIPIANLNESGINALYGTTNAKDFAGFPPESCLFNSADWPDYRPIPGRNGLQVDVVFDIVAFNKTYVRTTDTGIITGYPNGPNFQPDTARFNRSFEVGRKLAGNQVISPFTVMDWTPAFQPINI